MKARESGMPNESAWAEFFDVETILRELEVNRQIEKLVELGFGYGTFTIPTSKKICGVVYAFDIETTLRKELQEKLKIHSITNVKSITKDFIAEGSGLQNDEVDYVMIFNLLHAKETPSILDEAYRILKKKGKIGVIHWNYNSSTPRGPSMSIRPKPEELKEMLIKSGFSVIKYNIDLPPYHYGILGQK